MTTQSPGKIVNPLHARKRARKSALQALYQWQLSGQSLKDIDEQFRTEQDMSRVDMEYFHELLHKVPAVLTQLDEVIALFVDRPVEQIDPVERAVLRIAIYELKFRAEIPYRVVLNESVSLAKTFGATESHKYINGVLDKAAKELRKIEYQQQI